MKINLRIVLDNIASSGMLLGMILEYLARAIEESGKTRYQISKDTGIDQAVLYRIMSGGSCGTKTVDKLCLYLGLELVKKREGKKR